MELFCECSETVFIGAVASLFFAEQAALWLRDRILTRLYLAVHPRTGRFPLAELYCWGKLFYNNWASCKFSYKLSQ